MENVFTLKTDDAVAEKLYMKGRNKSDYIRAAIVEKMAREDEQFLDMELKRAGQRLQNLLTAKLDLQYKKLKQEKINEIIGSLDTEFKTKANLIRQYITKFTKEQEPAELQKIIDLFDEVDPELAGWLKEWQKNYKIDNDKQRRLK